MSVKKRLNIILATTSDMGIGLNNELPWPWLKSDMKFF